MGDGRGGGGEGVGREWGGRGEGGGRERRGREKGGGREGVGRGKGLKLHLGQFSARKNRLGKRPDALGG